MSRARNTMSDPPVPSEVVSRLARPRVVRLRPPRATIALLVGMGVYFAMTEIAGGSGSLAVLVAFGANFGPLVAAGESWRLVTSMFLHAGLLHLALNGWALFILGRNLEAFYGAWRFLTLFLLSGLVGAAASALLSGAVSVGASGGVFGLLGASLVFAFRWRSILPGRVTRVMGTALVPWVALNLLLGVFVPRIDMVAHVGGLLAGAALAAVLVPDTIREARGLVPPWPRFLASLCISLLLAGFGAAGRNIFRMRGEDGAILDPRVVTAITEMNRREALRTLDDALERDPRDAELLRSRGDVRTADGDWAEAIADYRAALESAPDDPHTLNNLAWLLLEEAPDSLRNAAEAARLAERAARAAPDDPYVLGTWGTARLRAGDAVEAARLLARALESPRATEDEATDRYLLAIALARAGQKATAERAWRAAVRLDPANRYRAEAESTLAAVGPDGTGSADSASASAESQSAPAP